MKNTQNNSFSRKLYELRHSSSLTQSELAEKINVSRSCLANYENGRRFPDDSIVEIIASYFNVSKEYLLGEDKFSSEELRKQSNINFKKVKPKNGKLDISEISIPSKIALVELCNFLEDSDHNIQKAL